MQKVLQQALKAASRVSADWVLVSEDLVSKEWRNLENQYGHKPCEQLMA